MLKSFQSFGSGGSGGSGNVTVQINGSNIGSQSNINFVPATNINILGTNDISNSAIVLTLSGGVSYPWFMS